MAHEPAHHPLDVTDPHHDLPHAHVMVSPRTLGAVLFTLLIFTALTVFLSQAERAVAETLGVVVPTVVNVGVVMVIAVTKGALVAMYFMQLRYDSFMNTVIFLFCLFALALFLFLSMLDLGTRNAVYSWKAGEIQAGGLGIDTTRQVGGMTVGINTSRKPITEWARERRIEQFAAQGVPDPDERYRQEFEIFAGHGHAAGHGKPAELSSPNRIVRRTGTTPDLFAPAAPAAETHGHH